MNKAEKLRRVMLDWYKPTKRGERAREMLAASGQAGAIGEDVDKVEEKKNP